MQTTTTTTTTATTTLAAISPAELQAMIKTGKSPPAFAGPQQVAIDTQIVGPLAAQVKKGRLRNKNLVEMNGLYKRTIDGVDRMTDKHFTVKLNKRYTHTFKDRTRTGICVDYQIKAVMRWDDAPESVTPIAQKQLKAVDEESDYEESDD